MTTPDLRPMLGLVRQLRPDWDTPGVVAAVTAALRDGWTLAATATAAIDAAADPTTSTPAGITARLAGNWLRGHHAPPTPAPPRRPETCEHGWRRARCPHCPGGRLAHLDTVP